MAQSEWGLAGPVETYADSAWDPTQGWDQEQRWKGYSEDIVVLGNAFRAAGWKVRVETTGSQWSQLIVSIPNNGNEDYIDRWEFNIGFKQQELFLNIAICNYLQLSLTPDEVIDLRKTLQQYLEAPTPNGAVVDALGAEIGVIYQMMQMGQEFVEVAQPTISRKRTYGYNFTGTIMATQTTQNVWSTNALIGAFGIPAQVAAQISPDPSAAPITNYAYGWKMRKNNLVIIPSKNKTEEQLEWEWDQWNTIAYNYIS
jgi:hypothetical protein